ncbi:MAG TPA: hypothetical protein VHF89_03005 [Solirubrobacteraceae bacterium]|nr:hypothetical protein [Solirubrobacteraceae bacterium]
MRTIVVAAAVFAVVAGTAGAVIGGVVGGPPSIFGRDEGPAPEDHLEITRGTVVLGVGELPRSGRWELVGHRYRQRGRPGPDEVCLDVSLVRWRTTYGCASPEGRVQGTHGQHRVKQITGAANEPGVRRVQARYGDEVVEASLVEVDRETAALVGIGHPFRFYVAELPEAAQDVVLEALDEDGGVVWREPCPLRRC